MKVYTEGKPDVVLVRCLGISNRYIIKRGAKGKVFKSITKEINSIGIVDEDLSPPPRHFQQFILKEEKYNLKTYYHPINNNLLIVVCPDFEPWLLRITRIAKVDITSFKLSTTPKKLHQEITTNDSNLIKLEKLINHLLEKDNKPLHYLKSLLGEA